MKKILALLVALFALLLMSSCGETVGEGASSTTPSNPGTQSSDDNGGDTTTTTDKNDTTDTTKPSVTDKTEDTQNGTTDTSKPGGDTTGSTVDTTESGGNTEDNEPEDDKLDLSAPTVEGILGSSMGVFDSADTFGNEGKISGFTNYTYQYDLSKYVGKQIIIKTGGQYRFYGKSINTQIFISPTAKGQSVSILLDNVNISYTGSGPVIFAEKCDKVTIATATNSVNYLTDNSKNGENGVIKVKSCNLVMDGKGKLVIVAKAKNGIANTKELTINGGEYDITAVGHGIYGKLGLTINGGKYNIKSDKSGFKSGDDEVGNEVEGNIVIKACSAKITSGTNGINAYGAVTIQNGRFTIDAGTKGIDAKNNIAISGGVFVMDTDEDAVNCKADISVSGNASFKINTRGNGYEGANVTVTTTGVIYIKTSPVYVIDNEKGEFKKIDGEYVPLDGTEKPTLTKYRLVECKGFEVKNLLKINKVTLGIDSYEDGLNAVNIEIEGGVIAISTTKDGMDASENVVILGTSNVVICSSDKGIKAAKIVAMRSGTTKIIAKTDAVKADTVMVEAGKHILYEKVEFVTKFQISGGTFISVATTKEPVLPSGSIPNAYGAVENKNLCNIGEIIILTLGKGSDMVQETLVLYKDYTDKMSVFIAGECMGDGTIEIGEDGVTEKLTKGKF